MLTPRQFWSRFSRRQFDLEIPVGLAAPLGYASLFDQLFGRLVTHRVEELSASRSRLRCTGCDQVKLPLTDVCETHIGVIAGQLERRFGKPVTAQRRVASGICHMVFERRQPESDP